MRHDPEQPVSVFAIELDFKSFQLGAQRNTEPSGLSFMLTNMVIFRGHQGLWNLLHSKN